MGINKLNLPMEYFIILITVDFSVFMRPEYGYFPAIGFAVSANTSSTDGKRFYAPARTPLLYK